MPVESSQASWSSLPPIDAVQEPRRLTRADVPCLGDRLMTVLSSEGRQYRSGWETAVSFISIAFVTAASVLIWRQPTASIGMRIVETILAVLLMIGVATAIMVKLRFRE
jgi:hypothetical protein